MELVNPSSKHHQPRHPSEPMYLPSHQPIQPSVAGHTASVNGDAYLPRPGMSHADSSNGAYHHPSASMSPHQHSLNYDTRRLIGLDELADAALGTERISIQQPPSRDPSVQQIISPSPGLSLTQTHPSTIPVPGLSPARDGIDDTHLCAPSHPTTVSTSSEEPNGKPHDVFSSYDTDDTVTDPDVEGPRRLEKHIPAATAPDAVAKTPATSQREVRSLPIGDGPTDGNAITTSHAVSTTTLTLAPKDSVPERSNEALLLETSPDQILPDMDTTNDEWLPQEQCSLPGCPPDVPQMLLSILDNPAASGILARQYASHATKLCYMHIKKFAALMISIEQVPAPRVTGAHGMTHQTGNGTRWKPLPHTAHKRAIPLDISASAEGAPPTKKQRPDECISPSLNTVPTWQANLRPSPDTAHDEAYRQQMLVELGERFTQKDEDDLSRGELTNRLIHAILTKIKHPNADPRDGPVDAGFMTGVEAASMLSKGILDVPIFTQGQQQFQWSNIDRPISELFRRMEDLGRTVSVQIPSIHWDSPSAQRRTLVDVQQRFLDNKKSDDPWNILDLRSPLPPSVLPTFLTGENCQLLPRMRDALLMGDCAERTKAMRQEWNEWTELLEWVLLSEGGHNTAPHMDSHGWATWITVQEGLFGFGWMARPTDAEQNAWMADPIHYTGGNWRFLILKPGQTVFFPTGTIHFVFRLRSEQTLAVGGHVLQWSGIERWIMIILNQLKNPSITNEDLGVDVLKYVRTVASLVTNRLKQCRLGELGTIETAQRFLVLTNEVERHFQRKKKRKSKR